LKMFTKTLKIQEVFQGDLMVDNEHVEAVKYYLEKEGIWNYFKECIIVQVEETLWIVDGMILRCPIGEIPIIFERWFNG